MISTVCPSTISTESAPVRDMTSNPCPEYPTRTEFVSPATTKSPTCHSQRKNSFNLGHPGRHGHGSVTTVRLMKAASLRSPSSGRGRTTRTCPHIRIGPSVVFGSPAMGARLLAEAAQPLCESLVRLARFASARADPCGGRGRSVARPRTRSAARSLHRGAELRTLRTCPSSPRRGRTSDRQMEEVSPALLPAAGSSASGADGA